MKKNTTGVKLLKSILFFLAGTVILALVLPVVFSVVGPMITALPFEVPMNFIVADYIGMTAVFVSFGILLLYTKKWAWR